MKNKNIYNSKEFLLPESHRSMACYHAKVMEDDIMKITIHDCRRSIQLKNNLDTVEEVHEAIEKLNTLANGINELKNFIRDNYL